jgi:gliding motility-associated-like protein
LKAVLLVCFIGIPLFGWPQTFPAKGQFPSTAYPICGTDTFRQLALPLGFTTTIRVPGCDQYPDTNPFFYDFTCYRSGTLGFDIIPNNPLDDYDWMLFDITGFLPGIIYTDTTIIVNGNRSAMPGPTGARNGGIFSAECSSGPSDNVLTYTKLLYVTAGHRYILLISHSTPLQSGYDLSFNGTAVLNDPSVPQILSVVVRCDKKTLTVGITKFVRCNSLASDGSDFAIVSSSGSIIQATGLNCSPQFDFDYLELSVSDPLPPGNYSLILKNGSDGNTLLDDCGIQAPDGSKFDFTVSAVLPVLDSIVPPTCQSVKLDLVFSNPVKCSSIAPDGSDFKISGSSTVDVIRAESDCAGSLTSQIRLTLRSPIVVDGNYQVSMTRGTDGNTITNECDSTAPSGSTISFEIKGSVSAAFDYSIGYGCIYDTISLHFVPANGVNQWLWMTDFLWTSTLPDTSILENIFGSKTIQHIVSNGFCSDTVSETINLDNILTAAFEAPKEVCPKNLVTLADRSAGKIISWLWDFGDGTLSSEQNPPGHLYPNTRESSTYRIRLIVENDLGCEDTSIAQIIKLQSCYISVPNAFTPNGDGKNDWLYPLNTYNVSNFEFRVYNRLGQLVFETRDRSKKWDGTLNGRVQESGVYVWMLNYMDESGKNSFLKGTTVLIR